MSVSGPPGLSDNEELAALYDSAPVGLCVLDRELRFVRINSRLAEMNGVPAADHIGRQLPEILPDIGEQAKLAMQRILAGETLRSLEFEGATPAHPGAPRSWRGTWVPLKNPQGEVIAASVMVEEVTEGRRARQALRLDEERLRFGLEAGRMVAWEFDLRTGRSRRSANAKLLFGLEPGGGDDIYALVHPDDVDRLKALQARAVAGEAPYEVEVRMRGPDGEMRWGAIRGQVRRDRHGHPVKMAGVIMDITARKEAELAASRAAAEFEALAENVNQLAWMAHPDGSIFWFNRRWYEFTGMAPGEIHRNTAARTLVHPDHVERVRATWSECFARGERWEDTFPLRGADGGYRWFLTRAEPIRDESGAIVRWFGTNTDVTEQMQTAEALAESEARFRVMFDTMPALVFVTSPSGEYVDVNEGFRSYTGCTTEELLEERWLAVLHPDDHDRAREIWGGAVRAQTVYIAEHRFRRRDGAFRWHLVRGLPVRDERGEVRSWIGACVDIHERRLAEEELRLRVDEAVAARETALFQLHEAQKLETIGQLTGGVAHDFNNLLTPIVGSLDLLRRRIEDDRSARLIEGALAAAERARTLIHRLLAFARRQTLQPRAVDPEALVEGMRDLIERSLGPRIEFVTEVEPDLPPALVDPNQLELALLNLSVNSRDAMPGGGMLTWHLCEEDAPASLPELRPGRYLRMTISDTGMGMSQETLARAVEPFFSTKAAGKGTGLGLSMVHGLAAQSGGAFRLESRPGEGTKATLWLPVAGESVPVASREPETRTAARRAVILLVEDDDRVRYTTAESLSELGYEVQSAISAETALDQVARGLRPDLLVTDHLMPGMTGAQLAQEVRRQLPGLPVLMITGYAQLRPEETGGLDVLVKPYRHAELALRVAQLLAGEAALENSVG